MAFVFTGSFVDGEKREVEEGARVLMNKVLGAVKQICGGRNGVAKTKRDHELPSELPTLVDRDGVKYPVQYPKIRAGLDFPSPPARLRQERDELDDDWKENWKSCTIEFSPREAGASVFLPTRRIMIGPFFLGPQYSVRDFEKIILHEYLHTTLRVKPPPEMKTQYDHGQIEQILIYNLHYRPPATPGGVS
jgi:hypothetical protein